MSNSIINASSSNTVGSPSLSSSSALPHSGDVFANLFQTLNSSARVQISEGPNAINFQDIDANVIKTAIDTPKSHLTDQANEIVEQLNVAGSKTLDLIDSKAFKIPTQHTTLNNDSDSDRVSRAIVEIEEISTIIVKLISEETLSDILPTKEGKIHGADLPSEYDTVLSTNINEIGLTVEDFYDDFSSKDLPKDLPKDLSTYSLKGIESFELASSDLESFHSTKDQKTVKIFLGDVESYEAVVVTVTANQDKNTFVKTREISRQFSEPSYTSPTISETDNELVLKIHRPNGPPGVVVVEINELLENADFDQKLKVNVIFDDPDPKAITTSMRDLNKLSSTVTFEYAKTDTSQYEISEISSEIGFDKIDILMVKEKLKNLLDRSRNTSLNNESIENIKDAISKSIETTEIQGFVSAAIRKVSGNSLGEHRKTTAQASLMVSSADLAPIKADTIKPVYVNPEVFKAFNGSRENIAAASPSAEVRADTEKPVYVNQEVFRAFNGSRENIAAASSSAEIRAGAKKPVYVNQEFSKAFNGSRENIAAASSNAEIRADAIKPVYVNQEVFRAFNGSRENIAAASSINEIDKTLKSNKPTAENTEHDPSRFIERQLKLSNDASQTEVIVKSPSTSFLNSHLSRNLSILDAQFASRLAAVAVEQAMTMSESIELNLEPKSFGKLQINASLDNSGLEIKLTAENSATIAILRGTEGLLSSITEQHGLRLSHYNVDYSHGEGGGQSRKDHSENFQDNMEKRSPKNEESMQTGDGTIDANRLLNLIA